MRAQRRYSAAHGDFYAAGISYFTLFAMFPLLMVGFATVGVILAGQPALLSRVDAQVKAAVPSDFAAVVTGLMDAAISSRASIGVLGLAAALWAGLSWMDNLRTALSEMWQQPTGTAGFIRTKASDLAALASAFFATLLILALSGLSDPVARLSGGLRVLSLLGSVLVAWLMFSWMIAKLPRQPVPLRTALRAGLLAAVGFEVVKQLASGYLRVVLHGPAGVIFGPVLGLMVFAYVTARLVLFAAAWAATAPAPDDCTNAPP